MSKQKLEIEYDYDFALIGISSHDKDYRICWALNNALSLDMRQDQDLAISLKKEEKPSLFSLYFYNDEEFYREYYLVANKSSSGMLIPEHKHMDYFLIVKGSLNKQQLASILEKIKNISMVLTAISIDAATLKSKQNLIF